MNVLEKFEQKNIAEIQAKRDVNKFEDFNIGDTIDVGVRIADIAGFRTQHYEGVCIGRSNKSIRSSFTVRRIGAGSEGIEQTFMYYLSSIESIKVVRRGSVRRAKLYYLRGLRGKAARIKEKFFPKKDGK